MAEEINMKDLQMQGLTEKIDLLQKGFYKSKRQELDLYEIRSRLKEFKTAHDSAQLELNALGPHMLKAELTRKLRDHKHAWKEMQEEYELRKKEFDEKALMHGAKTREDRAAAVQKMSTADGLMQHGLDTQAKSTAVLKNVVVVIEEAKNIGIDIVAKVEGQNQQIAKTYDTLEEIDTTLARSTKVIKRMARKMATDKVIWIFAFLVFCAIVAILTVKYVKRKNN